MIVRYALIDMRGPYDEWVVKLARRVHLTDGDETSMTLCGQFASKTLRFSRSVAEPLKGKPLCKNCLRARDR